MKEFGEGGLPQLVFFRIPAALAFSPAVGLTVWFTWIEAFLVFGPHHHLYIPKGFLRLVLVNYLDAFKLTVIAGLPMCLTLYTVGAKSRLWLAGLGALLALAYGEPIWSNRTVWCINDQMCIASFLAGAAEGLLIHWVCCGKKVRTAWRPPPQPEYNDLEEPLVAFWAVCLFTSHLIVGYCHSKVSGKLNFRHGFPRLRLIVILLGS
jgi:hypothetical protein